MAGTRLKTATGGNCRGRDFGLPGRSGLSSGETGESGCVGGLSLGRQPFSETGRRSSGDTLSSKMDPVWRGGLSTT